MDKATDASLPAAEKAKPNKDTAVQDWFLNTVRQKHLWLPIYLVNGIKLQGCVVGFDQYTILLEGKDSGKGGSSLETVQQVNKHAVSTVVPVGKLTCPCESVKPSSLQDHYLDFLRQGSGGTGIPVAAYLVNGIKLLGTICAFDRYTVVLLGESGGLQLVYKHAISTVCPNKRVVYTFEGGVAKFSEK